MASSVGDMNWLLVLRHVTNDVNASAKFFFACAVLETEGLAASQPVSKKLGGNPALSF